MILNSGKLSSARTHARCCSPVGAMCVSRITQQQRRASHARGAAARTPTTAVVAFSAVAGRRQHSSRPSSSALVCRATALDRAAAPSLQLATARLPPGVDPVRFAQLLYQWAATLTQNGANLPFVSPLKADKLPTGFQISMLKRSDKTRSFGSVGDIVGTVEEQDGVGPVLMVRFFEGEVAQDNKPPGWVPPSDPTKRLELVLAGCVDVDTVMSGMPQAIRIAAKACSSDA